MTGPEIFTPEYYERMRELEDAGWWNAGMRNVAARLLREIELPEEGRFLDVGCGSGQTMTWFRRSNPRWNGIGLDVAREGLTSARRLGETVLAASALELPFEDDSMDLAITLDVLQHLPLGGGDRRALAEISRVLRPGGHLLVRTNAQAFPVTPDDPEYNFHKYEVGELRQKLELAGFSVLRLSRINALLGLAEIPRELRAHRESGRRYHGILARPASRTGLSGHVKRTWLEIEGMAVARGWSLPVGRTLIALCRS